MSNRCTQFRIEEKHALAAAKLIMRRKLKVPILPFLVIAVVVAAVALSMGGSGTLGQAMPILAWLVLTLAFILGVVQFWVLPRQTRRMFHQTSLLREQIAFSWDETGFALEGACWSSLGKRSKSPETEVTRDDSGTGTSVRESKRGARDLHRRQKLHAKHTSCSLSQCLVTVPDLLLQRGPLSYQTSLDEEDRGAVHWQAAYHSRRIDRRGFGGG